MKRLLLIRHAKSSWKFPELEDHDRPLNGRGERDRWRMAEYLKDQNEGLQLIRSSSAVRAAKLANTLAELLGVPVEQSNELYTFGARTLCEVIKETAADIDRLAVIGHNPAITDLSERLTGAMISNVPTSGIVAINCGCDCWQDLAPEVCELDFFTAPKLLS